MASKQVVTKVWIEPGCIVCDACETTAPDVFEVLEDTCIVRPAALTTEFTRPRTQEIIDAAEECPVDVIKYDTTTVEVSEIEGAPAPAAEGAVSEGPKPAPARVSEKKPLPNPEPALTPAKAEKSAEPAAAKVAASARGSVAGEPDLAIAALLRAATSRGGNAGIIRRQADVPETVSEWKKKDPRELPPDARNAMIVAAARRAKQEPDKERRAFMSNAALAVGWGAFGVATGTSTWAYGIRFMTPNVLEEPDPRVRVGKMQRYHEMAPGEVIEDFKPQGIWLVRDGEKLAALSIICTHLGCIPNWLPNDRKFKCPCHGSGYKPSGINFEGPTPRPLERFKLYIEDGVVVVDKSKKYQYELGQWEMPGSYLEL